MLQTYKINLVLRVSHLLALPEQERRDPGTGWSHVTLTIENIRERSFSSEAICHIELC